jgi:hypothetical protein
MKKYRLNFKICEIEEICQLQMIMIVLMLNFLK